ncbi:MAG: DUF2202 domain-containing protein [Candidatus Gracilibacteria bacterium]|nr:DUF2202 domain-containing protein [Candidatus Gracilibacteria bacterium]
MKTKNILLSGITIGLLIVGITGTYAMGNGMGNGSHMGNNNGMGSSSQKMGSGSGMHNTSDLLIGVPTSELSAEEKQELLYGYNEETLAHDLYTYFYELYNFQTFSNIASSEAEHQTAVKVLLDRYNLEVRAPYGELNETYAALKAEGEISLQKALEVGIKIEMLDIDDISKTIKNTDNDDLKIVFTNIGGASCNHLRAFARGLSYSGLTTDIDYSDYLPKDEINSTGSLKYKLAEKLEAEGVDLPTQTNTNSIKQNCVNYQDNTNLNSNTGNNSGLNLALNSNYNSLKNKYRNSIETKYASTIGKMSQTQLKTLVTKLDEIALNIRNKNYNSYTKQNYFATFDILKEMANGKISR